MRGLFYEGAGGDEAGMGVVELFGFSEVAECFCTVAESFIA